MNRLLQEHADAIAELCRRHGVRKLELFGSAAAGTFEPGRSDLDFFVEFIDSGWEGSFKRYMGLKLGLEDLLGRSVDLVEPRAVTNSYFIQQANQARELVFAA